MADIELGRKYIYDENIPDLLEVGCRQWKCLSRIVQAETQDGVDLACFILAYTFPLC